MSRIASRVGAVTIVLAAGVGASLALTPQGQSRPLDCVVGVCLPPTTVLPVPVPVPLPSPTETTPTTTSTAQPAAPPASAPAPSAPSTTAPAQSTPAPAVPTEGGPSAQPGAALTAIKISVTGKSANRVLALTMTLARPANVAMHAGFRPRAVRASFELGAGRYVRKIKIPVRTRPGRYVLTLAIRSAGSRLQTQRRTVFVFR